MGIPRFRHLLKRSCLYKVACVLATLCLLYSLSPKLTYPRDARKTLHEYLTKTLLTDNGVSFHWNRLFMLSGDSSNLSSPNLEKSNEKTKTYDYKKTTELRTSSWGHTAVRTLQQIHRHMPNIVIPKGQNKSLEVLLRRGVIEPATDLVTTDTKIILWYSPTRYHPVLWRLHPLRGCPESRCRVTTNRAFYEQSDALVFTAQLLDKTPPEKLKNQVWVLHNHESPRWSKKEIHLYNGHWSSMFNWTMDYRADSDIRAPYAIFQMNNGTFRKREQPPRNYTQIWSYKKGTVAWMVSNCKTMSRRKEYVLELSKYIQVDIYGRCGNIKCPRSDDESCLKHISKKYKFYLAFENAFCKDYITEKFFRYFNSDMVLVTRGGGDYTAVAPPGTFINTADFVSPQRLAQHLAELADSERDYVNILRLKDQYQSVWEEYPIVRDGNIVYMTYHYDAMPMCELCERLWHVDKYRTFYTDIEKWFDKGICFQPNDLSS